MFRCSVGPGPEPTPLQSMDIEERLDGKPALVRLDRAVLGKKGAVRVTADARHGPVHLFSREGARPRPSHRLAGDRLEKSVDGLAESERTHDELGDPVTCRGSRVGR